MYAAFILGCAVALPLPAAHASEAQFLRTLDGQYEGQGRVRLRTNKAPINVNCRFSSVASDTALTLEGRCRGLIVVSRSIGAKLRVKGNSYTGSYIGAGSGPASLSGRRNGSTLNLSIRWAKAINGDRQANLSVARVGARGLTLTTSDRDPASGKMVVTSKIVLQRR